MLALSCSENKDDRHPQGTVRVQLPVYDVEAKKYKLEVVELSTVQDMVELKGTAAKILLQARVFNQKLNGDTPLIKTIRDSNGVYIPADTQSLQALSVYAHFEKLLNLDELLDIKKLNQWPRTVAMKANYQNKQASEQNNAFYTSKYDAFLIVPYTESEIPLAVNAGVIGHEHFHSIFQRIVIDPMGGQFPLKQSATTHDAKLIFNAFGILESNETLVHESQTEKQIYDAILIRALNEGLADVWGWIYSGDTDFVARSLPQQGKGRKLDIGIGQKVHSIQNLRNMIQQFGEPYYMYFAYQTGTQLAQNLKSFSNIYQKEHQLSSQEAQLAMARLIVKTLPELKDRIMKLSAEKYMGLANYLDIFTSHIENPTQEMCDFFAQVIPDDEKKDLKSKCTQGEL